jgi:hypothetical protein
VIRAFKQRDLSGKPLLAIALLLFLAGVLNDPPWKGYGPGQHVVYLSEAERVAGSLYHSGAFANPFGAMATGPTAHVAPVFPFLQSLLLRLCGEGAGGWLALRTVSVVALSLQFALLPYCARLFGYGSWVGVLASVLGLIAKPGKEEHWEAHLAGLVALLLTASCCLWMERGRGWWIGLCTGVIAGVAILLQPVIVVVYAGWLLCEISKKNTWPLWVAPLILCTPWMIRNEAVLGFVGIRDNLGTELYVSFNDCAPYGVRESEKLSCFERLHPNTNVDEARAVRAMGEHLYNESRFRTAIGWIAGRPARALVLVGQRIWFFWFPSDDGWNGYLTQRKRMLFSHLLTVASILGLILSVKQRVRYVVTLGLWLLLYPAIYYVIQFEVRYRYPILWATWLMAAYAAVRLSRSAETIKWGETRI